MYLMAIEAPYLPVIHIALHKIVPLHSVLMRGQIGILKKVRRPRLQLLQPPVIHQPLARHKPHRPVVVFSRNRIRQWLSLAVALNARIVASHIVQPVRIHDIVLRWMGDMQAPWPMALFTSHIPLRHRVGLHVVVHGMTPITRRPRRPVKVRRPIERHPPVRPTLHVIRQPFLLRHIPLRRQRIVVIPTFRKKSLLPPAPIHKCNLIEPKGHHWIGMQKIRQHRLRMFLRIANHIRHPRLLPSVVRRRVTTLATLRPDKRRLRNLRSPHVWRHQQPSNAEQKNFHHYAVHQKTHRDDDSVRRPKTTVSNSRTISQLANLSSERSHSCTLRMAYLLLPAPDPYHPRKSRVSRNNLQSHHELRREQAHRTRP